MRKLYLLIATSYSICAYSQTYRQQNFENTMHGLTTIINISKGKDSSKPFGTGFFYHKYDYPPGLDPSQHSNSIDSTLKSIWLVTNKHVMFGKEHSHRKRPPFPEAISFHLRRIKRGLDRPIWDTIIIKKGELTLRTKYHKDSLTDIIAIDITNFVLPKLLKGDSLYYYSAVSSANFPLFDSYVNGPRFSVGNQVLSIGYPQEFYDRYNLYPTIKTGIIASKWTTTYNGNPYFLIDYKLFPGSSGSIVVSMPTTYGNVDYFPFFRRLFR